MFGSEMLDVALGLVLVFLLVSLVLTAVQEAIEAWLRSRAGDLNRAIYELLQRDDDLVEHFYRHPLIFALHRAGLGDDLSHAIHKAVTGKNPFTRVWRDVRAARAKLPSYIPREAFSAALIDLLASGKAKGRIEESYVALDRLCGGDLTRLRVELGGWYDGAMDRASGWYKRRTQIILFWLGLNAAIMLNLNAVTIGNYLATNKQAREYATQYAGRLAGGATSSQGQGAAEGIKAPGTEEIGNLYSGLQDSVGLPIGWSPASTRKTFNGFRELEFAMPPFTKAWPGFGATFTGLMAVVMLMAGYLITGFAAMLGAPFWFDALNRIMVIRSTVKPTEKSPDEPSQDGGKSRAAQQVEAGAPVQEQGPAADGEGESR